MRQLLHKMVSWTTIPFMISAFFCNFVTAKWTLRHHASLFQLSDVERVAPSEKFIKGGNLEK